MTSTELIMLIVIGVMFLFFIGLGIWSIYRSAQNEKHSQEWKRKAREAGLPYEYWKEYFNAKI